MRRAGSHARLRCGMHALIWALLLLPRLALAHAGSTARLELDVREARATGTLDLALLDVDGLVTLDHDSDGAVTQPELDRVAPAWSSLVRDRLWLDADGSRCVAEPGRLRIEERGGEPRGITPLAFRCGTTPRRVVLRDDLVFADDALHRVLLRVDGIGGTRTGVLTADVREIALEVGDPVAAPVLLGLIGDGAQHVLSGADHVAFVATMLLPALLGVGVAGRSALSSRALLRATLASVTAFTAAHSTTLALAAVGWIPPVDAFTEPLIAASVTVGALHARRLVALSHRAGLAFGFGLVHGLGFAGALAPLALPRGALVPAILSFNLGVELAQLAIVLAVLPLLLALRRHGAPAQRAHAFATLGLAGIGLFWMAERIAAAL